MRSVLDAIDGIDGGMVPGVKEHECDECTHEKRYKSDDDGVAGSGFGVAGGEDELDVELPPVSVAN